MWWMLNISVLGTQEQLVWITQTLMKLRAIGYKPVPTWCKWQSGKIKRWMFSTWVAQMSASTSQVQVGLRSNAKEGWICVECQLSMKAQACRLQDNYHLASLNSSKLRWSSQAIRGARLVVLFLTQFLSDDNWTFSSMRFSNRVHILLPTSHKKEAKLFI